jgi:hypothetical protein
MKLPFEYLLDKPKHRLKEFGMNQRGRASSNWKQAREAIDAAIEAEAYALLALWIEQYGEELIEAARDDSRDLGAAATPTQPSAAPLGEDRERPIAGREFWRASVKRFYRRAG